VSLSSDHSGPPGPMPPISTLLLFSPGTVSCHKPRPEGGLALKKLYVGNLPFQATEEQVTTLFTQTGRHRGRTCTLVRDRFSGQPRGFGFVEVK